MAVTAHYIVYMPSSTVASLQGAGMNPVRQRRWTSRSPAGSSHLSKGDRCGLPVVGRQSGRPRESVGPFGNPDRILAHVLGGGGESEGKSMHV